MSEREGDQVEKETRKRRKLKIGGEKIEEERQDTKERGQRREETETQSASRGQCNLTDNAGL